MDIQDNNELEQQLLKEETVVPPESEQEVPAEPAPEEIPGAEDTFEEMEKTEKKRTMWEKIWRILLTSLVALVILSACCAATAVLVNRIWGDEIKRNEQYIDQLNQTIAELREEIRDNSYTGNGNSVSGTPNVSPDGMTPGQVYAQNVDSVVAITAQVTTTNIYGQSTKASSSGSGFIISSDGYIVTNFHVVEKASSVEVTTYQKTTYPAKIIGYDQTNDLAVLKVEAQGLAAAKLGSSDDLIVGDQVVAIGNPLGKLTSTLTVGYISAKDRNITTDGTVINMLQTDAAINSGNSGGPLFNMKGEVVGITTAKYSGVTNSGATIEGIGFAIPIDDVLKKITDLQTYGYITGAALGVMVREVDRTIAEAYGLPLGCYVDSVIEGQCADIAGVQEKDIIIVVGEYKVAGMNDLARALEQFMGGENTTITVWRGGREVVLDITLDAKVQTPNA